MSTVKKRRVRADGVRPIDTLSPRQRQVLDLMVEGLMNKQIAYQTGLTEGTVKVHVSAIMRKLGATTRSQAVAASLRARLDELEAAETLEAYYSRQITWSRETFGPALRTKGVLDHIRKECAEVEANPHDLSEWVDLIILAMDGFWRHGGKVEDLMPALLAKQRKNMARTWPDWRAMSEDRAIEHDRSQDRPTLMGETP